MDSRLLVIAGVVCDDDEIERFTCVGTSSFRSARSLLLRVAISTDAEISVPWSFPDNHRHCDECHTERETGFKGNHTSDSAIPTPSRSFRNDSVKLDDDTVATRRTISSSRRLSPVKPGVAVL
jgi:hypothetical protein